MESIILRVICLLSVAVTTTMALAAQSPQARLDAGRVHFESHCAPCHGGDGRGSDRGPSIVEGASDRSKDTIRTIIRNGVPAAGMPAFRLPTSEEAELVDFVYSLTAPAAESGISGNVGNGKNFFWGKGRCGDCHAVQGHGSVIGPDLTSIGRRRTLAELDQSLRQPGATPGYQVVRVRLQSGKSIRGFARNESNYDLDVQDLEGHFHFLRHDQIAEVIRDAKPLMPALEASSDERRDLLSYLISPPAPETSGASTRPTSENHALGEWPTYDGQLNGNRHSPLNQVTAKNVGHLAPRWMFPIEGTRELEVTPLVADGVMYVTTGIDVFALDARNGRQIWHYQRPLPKQSAGEPVGAVNRGVAIASDRVIVGTANAHLLALNRVNGGLIWDVAFAEEYPQYTAMATSAPLVVKDLVFYGIGGGTRGFVAAYKISTGERVWRFWTVPGRGEPLSETWVGRAIEQGCAPTWMNGTYDGDADIIYWTTGNPCPIYNGDERKGDNLYSDSVLAFRPATGQVLWHYQFTPHDDHDWDAQETPMLVDVDFHGQKRRLMLQANRNGFFYVLDRITGSLLLAKPFVDKLTWASEIGADGRPNVLPGTEPTAAGNKVCPSVEGATNWMSSAWDPETALFYVMALEKCSIYSKSPVKWAPGIFSDGGDARDVPREPGQKVVRAIDIQTGKRVWEYPQPGPADNWGGLLSTAGGLVFVCDDSGAFAALDSKTGEPLWHFYTNQRWHASPMTYMIDGKQYIAVASGSNIIAFGL
jgi:alcohol dehydrogenase (cytochrome c)